MDQFLSTETLIIELLLVASLVAIGVRRLRIPYTVALVVVGLLLAALTPTKFTLTSELILGLFVPPLLFEAAFHLNMSDLRRQIPGILLLAVPGVILTMLIVGGALAFGIHLSLPVALVFGALIAATDPVAVVALFRALGVPRQLAVLVEGESLFNDGTALVLFNLTLAVVVSGQFNFFQSLGDFVRIAIGGIAVGLLLGWIISRLIAQIDEYLIETTLTTVLAYGAYLLAEQLHFSGVLAVVAAGLVSGNLGRQGMSPTTRIVLTSFWEYVAFFTNSLVFLIIGLQIDIPSLLASWQPILWAIGAVLLARGVVIYGIGWMIGRLATPIPIRWQHVLSWGGLRGALSLALVLSLPASLGPERSLLLEMAFGVVLFTLLVQATSMSRLVRRLGIVTSRPSQMAYEMRQAELTASKAAEAHMERRYREGLLSSPAWEYLKPKLQEQNAELTKELRSILKTDPTLEREELELARREILSAKRSAYQGLRREGVISEETLGRLITQVDADLERERSGPAYPSGGTSLSAGEEKGEDGLGLRELVVEPGSSCEGKRIRHVEWPQGFIVARINRGDQAIVPGGETVLYTGDVLITVATEEAFQKARELCQARERRA